MIRLRKMQKWNSFEQVVHQSSEEFLNFIPSTGVHTVMQGKMPLDILFVNRGSKTTLVMFHAALSASAIRIPAFKGMGVAGDTGVNLISLADPSINMGDIDLAWFLGNEHTGYLPPVLAPLIDHLLKVASSDKTILFGTSGGAYAALNFASYFPDCFCLAGLPRLDLSAKPEAQRDHFLDIAFPSLDNGARADIQENYLNTPLYERFSSGLNFDLGIFHNLGDKTFFTYQVLPFIESLEEDTRLFTRVEWYGRGHLVVPGKPYRDIVSSIDSHESQRAGILAGGFTPTKQYLERLAE